DRSINEARRLKETGRRVLGSHRYVSAGIRLCSRRHDIGPIGVGSRIEISVGAGQNCERPPRTEFDDWSQGPVVEQPSRDGTPSEHLTGLEYRTPDEPMALVE